MIARKKGSSVVDYRPEIDGLRAFAVLPVILFHAGIQGFEGGFVGVDIFFVISGYLITRIILGDVSTGSFSLVKFYERRARRILPAYFAVVVSVLLVGWFVLLPSEYADLGKSVVAATIFVSNVYFWRTSDYFSPTAEELPLLHMWSLSVEEQFYVFFPLFLLLFWRLSSRWLLLSMLGFLIISFLTAEFLSGWKDIANFFLAPTRAWELLVGCLIGYVHRNGVTIIPRWVAEIGGALGITMIVLSIAALDPSVPFPSWWTWLPVGGAGLFITFSRAGTLASRLLSWRPIVFVGLVSYSSYLWHQPILVYGRFILIDEPELWMKIFFATLSVCIGIISWRYIERPFRNQAQFSRKAIFFLGGAGIASLCLTGIVLGSSNGFPSRLPKDALHYVSEIGEPSNVLGDCHIELGSTLTPCRIGSGPPRYFIFGDSHVRATAKSLDLALNRSSGFGSVVATVSGCGPFPDFERVGRPHCTVRAKKFVEYAVSENAPDIIVLMSRWPMYSSSLRVDNGEGGVEFGSNVEMVPSAGINSLDSQEENFKVALHRLIDKLLQAGKQVIVIGNPPEVGWRVPQRLARSAMTGADIERPISTNSDYYEERRGPLLSVIEFYRDDPRLLFLDPKPTFCNDGRCIAEVAGEPLYFDDDHLNARGAQMMASAFEPKFQTFLNTTISSK
jgi:peptidoglycan/LPS O-acetylase OafA/YrhL